MKSSVEVLEGHKVKLTIEVDETEIETEIDKAFKAIAREVRLPGFRPGKAPRKVLEARLGKGYARAQALEQSLPDYYRRAAIEHDVDVIAAPEFDLASGAEEGPVVFGAVVAVRPVVEIVGHGGLSIEIDDPAVADDDVDAQLDQLRGRFAERVTVEREAAEGDFVVIDIATTYEGEPVPGLTAEGYTYEVGSGGVVPELDEHLTGVSAGAEVFFEAAHPDPDEEGELEFAITVHEVQESQLPELTDEFAADASEFDTLAELRQSVVDRLTARNRTLARNQVVDRTGDALVELVEIEVPESLVQGEVQNRIQDLAMRLASQGMRIEQFLQMTGQSPEDFVAQLQEPAEHAAKADLALRAVAVAEDLDVTDDELDAEIEATAAQVGQSAEAVRAQFVENGQLSGIRWEMRKQKAMTWLLEHVTIVDTEGNTLTWESLQDPDEADDTETDTETETDIQSDAADEATTDDPTGEEE